LGNEDLMATLCAFSANAIIDAVERCFSKGTRLVIYLSGGGMHNPLLLDLLEKGLPNAAFFSTDDLGVNPDAKEAVLFALLANETLVGEAIDFGGHKGVPSTTMGKISLPF
jgi:anhydro-N-acetylmuramic acid kinase